MIDPADGLVTCARACGSRAHVREARAHPPSRPTPTRTPGTRATGATPPRSRRSREATDLAVHAGACSSGTLPTIEEHPRAPEQPVLRRCCCRQRLLPPTQEADRRTTRSAAARPGRTSPVLDLPDPEARPQPSATRCAPRRALALIQLGRTEHRPTSIDSHVGSLLTLARRSDDGALTGFTAMRPECQGG